MLFSFLNNVDIQLILEFKNSFEKYHTVFLKNHKSVFGTPYLQYMSTCKVRIVAAGIACFHKFTF